MGKQENMQASKQAYEDFGKGDLEAVMSVIDDDVEWIVPGESAVSGTYSGKQQVQEFFGKLAEKSFQTLPEHWLSEGEMIVVLTHWKMDGGEADAADTSTWRDGKIVKFQSAGDTALFERVFGKK